MIYYSTPGQGIPAVSIAIEEKAAKRQTYAPIAADNPPLAEGSRLLEGLPGQNSEITQVQDVIEEYDWESPKVRRKYVRLEQKVLAKKATADEENLYRSMNKNRRGLVFADRYVRDYAEVQRLQKLSQKLAEIQQYLRPITY